MYQVYIQSVYNPATCILSRVQCENEEIVPSIGSDQWLRHKHIYKKNNELTIPANNKHAAPAAMSAAVTLTN